MKLLKPLDTKDRMEKIKTDPEKAFNFARNVLKKRWPEAEPYIMKIPMLAADYSLTVMKNRWPEAEPIIKQDPEAWKKYKAFHLMLLPNWFYKKQ